MGATSVIRHLRIGRATHPSPWLEALLARKFPKLAAIAQANKTARIAWKLLVSGEAYDRAYDPAHDRARACPTAEPAQDMTVASAQVLAV